MRFVSLVENGTHVLFGSRMAGCGTGEEALAREVVGALSAGMLCLADRNFFSYPLWGRARDTGADLLWRVKKSLVLPCERVLPDGSYLSRIHPSPKARRRGAPGIAVRVVEYRLRGVAGAEPMYRLLTTVLEEAACPARELAALYHERWEVENALDELKTHLRGARIVLRSKTPKLVRQEFWGLMLAHFAVRSLMREAALRAAEDCDRLSFVHAVRVVQRKIVSQRPFPPPGPGNLLRQVLDELLDERVVPTRNCVRPRGVKRKMSGYPVRHGGVTTTTYDPVSAVEILK